MSMKERLSIHRQIEAENQENIEAAAAWDRCTVHVDGTPVFEFAEVK